MVVQNHLLLLQFSPEPCFAITCWHLRDEPQNNNYWQGEGAIVLHWYVVFAFTIIGDPQHQQSEKVWSDLLFVYNPLGLWKPYNFYSSVVRMVDMYQQIIPGHFLSLGSTPIWHDGQYLIVELPNSFFSTQVSFCIAVTWMYHVFYFRWDLAHVTCSKGALMI